MKLADAPFLARIDFELLQAIMGRAFASSRRPQECLIAEPDEISWADDHRSATFHYPGVTYLLSHQAKRGMFVLERRGQGCLVWSQDGEVVRAELAGVNADVFAEARQRAAVHRPELN